MPGLFPEITPTILSSAIAGAFALVTATHAGLWKLLDGHVKHWKERYDAKEGELSAARQDWKERYDAKEGELSVARQEIKQRGDEIDKRKDEIEKIRANPLAIAEVQVELYKMHFTNEINKLQNVVIGLQSELVGKDEKIRALSDNLIKNEAQITFYEEGRNALERKIAIYENTISQLALSRDIADGVVAIFKSNVLDTGNLGDKLQKELRAQMLHIDATSYDKTWRSTGEAAQAAATKKADAVNRELAARTRAIADMAGQLARMGSSQNLPKIIR
jgi:chromosome segregation ATPase